MKKLFAIILGIFMITGCQDQRLNTASISVPIARNTIEAGTTITEDMVDYALVPLNDVDKKVILSINNIMGKTANVTIEKDAYFYETSLK